MKSDKMPSTTALLVCSWIIAVFGFLGGLFLIISGFTEAVMLVKGFLIIAGSVVLAAVVRMFANIGQILFELNSTAGKMNSIAERISCDSKDINQNIYQTKTFFEQIEKHLDFKR